jgi:transcriptional regulator of heat shock response
MDDLSNLRKLVERLDELATIIEAANDKTLKNIEMNNLVVAEMDKAESMALSISQSHKKHNDIIIKMDKIIQDVDQLPRQTIEALSSIDLQVIEKRIEFLLKNELIELNNGISRFEQINKKFGDALESSYKNIRYINEMTNNDLAKFREAAQKVLNKAEKRSLLHFIYGFGFATFFLISFYFIFINGPFGPFA